MPAHTRRYDCERSRKGGKRSTVDRLNPAGGTVNPCFCHPYARCVDHATGRVYHAGDGTPAAAPCPARDPCTPCEAEDAALDPHAGYCSVCTADDRGKCLFTQGVGPYCKDG